MPPPGLVSCRATHGQAPTVLLGTPASEPRYSFTCRIFLCLPRWFTARGRRESSVCPRSLQQSSRGPELPLACPHTSRGTALGHTQRRRFPQLGVNTGGFSAEQLFWEGNIHDLGVHGPQGSESLGRPYRTSLVIIAQEAPINPRCL